MRPNFIVIMQSNHKFKSSVQETKSKLSYYYYFHIQMGQLRHLQITHKSIECITEKWDIAKAIIYVMFMCKYTVHCTILSSDGIKEI